MTSLAKPLPVFELPPSPCRQGNDVVRLGCRFTLADHAHRIAMQNQLAPSPVVCVISSLCSLRTLRRAPVPMPICPPAALKSARARRECRHGLSNLKSRCHAGIPSEKILISSVASPDVAARPRTILLQSEHRRASFCPSFRATASS